MSSVFDVEAMELDIICAFLAFSWVFNPKSSKHVDCPTKQTFLNGLNFLADTNIIQWKKNKTYK